MKDEALKLALETLEYAGPSWIDARQPAITAIKEALAQPEQEPVAFINVEQRKLEWVKYMIWDTPTIVNLPKISLYTTPPQRTWVGLTDSEIGTIAYNVNPLDGIRQFSRAIEAKLKEKNT